MNVELRISQVLYQAIHADLSRKHPFAAERVGFIACTSASLSCGGELLLAETYFPVEDSHYVDDPRAGATMGGAAIRVALQTAYNQPISMFHVHRHEHCGAPKFSGLDIRESRRFVPDFFKVQPSRCHGAIVLSHDSAVGLCWIPGADGPIPITKFVIVGRPINTVRARV